MSRLVDDPGYLFALVGLPGGLPSEQLAVTGAQEGLELVLVIEGRQHDIPPLSTHWVVPVVPRDEASDAVVFRIDPPHELEDRTEVGGDGAC